MIAAVDASTFTRQICQQLEGPSDERRDRTRGRVAQRLRAWLILSVDTLR